MMFAAEAQLLIINCTILGIAYLGIYPGLHNKSLTRLITVDLALSAVALTTAGALFWSSGVRFDMLVFQTNWAVFTLISFSIIEAPLFWRFTKVHGIRLFEDNDDGPE